MQLLTFRRSLRLCTTITLFFFCWSFGPLYAPIAYAAEKKPAKAKGNSPTSAGTPRDTTAPGSAERFEKALDAIRENVTRAGEKAARGSDDSAERAAIKAKRTEIEAADADLKKEFSATEKKLKAANLPDTIRQRHTAFVAQYEKNLKELKANLDNIDKAATKTESAARLEQARQHLEKTKTPSRHQKLDPNNLPNRVRKATTTREPRTKKEEFEKDFLPRKTQNTRNTAGVPESSYRGGAFEHGNRTILLAYNDIAGGIASDVPFSTQHPLPAGEKNSGTVPEWFDRGMRGGFDISQLAFADTAPYQLALATPPTADDLAETPEVQFTQDIKDLAAQLNYSPVKIYEYVRNNIEYVPTYGSIQGADMCLQTKQCNDMDTASLLIALLRTSGISAHYVYGTIEVPIDKVMNWAGGFSDPTAAGNFIASGNVPITGIKSGNAIVKAQIEHMWVEAYIPYGPYSGRSSKLSPSKQWLPLDASYKQYDYSNGVDLQAAVPFDSQSFINQLQAGATINSAAGYVTDVNSNYIQTAMAGYQAQVQNYLKQTMPTATMGDIIGKKTIKVQASGILPITLPYTTITTGMRYSELPTNLRHQISISLLDDTGNNTLLSTEMSLPEVAGKKITISYDPATPDDEALLASFATSTTASTIPVYLVNVKPILKIDGQNIRTGKSIRMGYTLPLKTVLSAPQNSDIAIIHNTTAGAFTAVVLDMGLVTGSQLDKLQMRVAATKTKLDASDLSGISKEDIMGDFLYGLGLSYWGMLDSIHGMTSQMYAVVDKRLPSEGTFTYNLRATYCFGTPVSAVPTGFTTDVGADQHFLNEKAGATDKELSYMMQRGMLGSRMEATIYDIAFNKTYTGRGISTAHILEYANQLGVPIYTIDSGNISTALQQLAVSSAVKTDIQNAVNAGLTVTIPQAEVTKDGWTGSGYLIFDKSTGSGVYKISDGLSGGGYQCNCFDSWPVVEFTIYAVLLGAGAFVPANAAVAIALAIIAILTSFFSTSYSTMNIWSDPALQEQREELIAITWGFYMIATVVTLWGISSGGLLGYLAASYLFTGLSLIAGNAIPALSKWWRGLNTKNEAQNGQ